MMEARCRNGDDGSEGDDATAAGGSEPQSPCLWQSAERQTPANAGHAGDKENADDNEANRLQVVPVDTFFGAPTFSLSALATASRKSEETQMPVMAKQSSSVAAAKDTLLLADLVAEMARKEQPDSQSPSSSIWSSPVAPQASAAASPLSLPSQPVLMPAQAPRVQTPRTFGKPSASTNHVLYLYPFTCLRLDEHKPDHLCMQKFQQNRVR